ncbi:hypothetical protein [Candidatus Methanomethylophilus sp. 1R26]|uniref:hypothetical protein n=1 Tax=Candidatus Methanomethylophilus sp. 1R26 TaxID=1769296 RepID=UPI001F40A8AF|nr:hypothetical protein [Candidatus Methanomethylophilus sp. 1R26]
MIHHIGAGKRFLEVTQVRTTPPDSRSSSCARIPLVPISRATAVLPISSHDRRRLTP